MPNANNMPSCSKQESCQTYKDSYKMGAEHALCPLVAAEIALRGSLLREESREVKVKAAGLIEDCDKYVDSDGADQRHAKQRAAYNEDLA